MAPYMMGDGSIANRDMKTTYNSKNKKKKKSDEAIKIFLKLACGFVGKGQAFTNFLRKSSITSV